MEWFNQISTYTPSEDEGIVASIPDVAPLVNLYEGDEYCGMEVFEEETYSAQDVKRLKAKRFVELIMSGKTPTKAAKELNEQLSRFQTKKEVQLAIVETLDKYEVHPQIRKRYSRAKLMEILANQDVLDPKSAKVALEAIKLIGTDEEVGYLSSKVQTAAPVVAIPEGVLRLLETGEKEEDEIVEGETDEDDKAA